MRDLPESWARVEIPDVLESNNNGKPFQQGWSPQCESIPAADGQWGVLRTTAIQHGEFWDQENKLLPLHLEPRPHIEVKPGDILMTCAGPRSRCGVACLVERSRSKLMMSGKMYRFRPHPEAMNPKYLAYFIETRESQIEIDRMKTGISDSGLNLTHDRFATLKVPVAPFLEQSRIVAKLEKLLSELDKGIESLTTAQEQLKVYRQAVLKHAFEGTLTADWREQNKHRLESADKLRTRLATERQVHHQSLLTARNTSLEKWKRSGSKGATPSRVRSLEPVTRLSSEVLEILPSLPTGWAWEKLAWMTCGVDYGTAAKSSRTGAMPVLRMGNLQNGRIDWSDLVFTDDAEEIAQYQLAPGDVLFNRTNSPELVGKTAIYRGERPALFAGYLIRLNHNTAMVDGEYLNLFLNSHVARQYGNTVKTDGVNQSNINGEKLQNYPFPFCSLAEQKEIVRLLDEKLSSCDRLLEEIEKQLERSSALRQSILKKAFSGQLVAQNPDDEPASVLLKRIKAQMVDATNGSKKSNKNNTKKEAA